MAGLAHAGLPVDLLLPAPRAPAPVEAGSAGDRVTEVRDAARQFESLFIGMMFKAMRDANAVFSEGGMLQSHEMTLRQEMLDEQWARHLAEHRGIGLAPVIERQMLGGTDRHSGPDRPAMAPLPARVPGLQASAPRPGGPQASASAADDPVRTLGYKAPGYADAGTFVTTLIPQVERALGGSGLDRIDVLAQGALETGWGQHMIHRADGSNANNLFGIKADDRWQGERVAVHTLEYRDGAMRREMAQFRAYPDVEAAIRDYIEFLRGSPRYEALFDPASGADADGFAKVLQRAGYATDPDYAGKLTSIAQRLRAELAL